jgi:hypothetical protein
MSRGGVWPPAVSEPLGGALVWPVIANRVGGSFSPLILNLHGPGDPVPVVLKRVVTAKGKDPASS